MKQKRAKKKVCLAPLCLYAYSKKLVIVGSGKSGGFHQLQCLERELMVKLALEQHQHIVKQPRNLLVSSLRVMGCRQLLENLD